MDEQLHDLTALYVVDALDHLERRRYEAHLETCDECRSELETLSGGMDVYAEAVSEPAPTDLKASVMAGVDAITSEPGTEVGPGRRVVGVITAVAAVVVIVVALGLTAGDAADRVLDADDAITYEVDEQPFTSASIVFSPDRGQAVFLGEGLPDPGEDMTYQLWLIGDDGPVSAGTFLPADGTARVLLAGEARTGLTVGLTIEPSGGSDAPTGDVLVAEPLA